MHDFGIGYGGFTYFKRLSVTLITIDIHAIRRLTPIDTAFKERDRHQTGITGHGQTTGRVGAVMSPHVAFACKQSRGLGFFGVCLRNSQSAPAAWSSWPRKRRGR
jgi:hypothetical protein